jgi:hypothetical protein
MSTKTSIFSENQQKSQPKIAPTSLCALPRSLSLSPTAVGPEAFALPLERNATQSNEIRQNPANVHKNFNIQ